MALRRCWLGEEEAATAGSRLCIGGTDLEMICGERDFVQMDGEGVTFAGFR